MKRRIYRTVFLCCLLIAAGGILAGCGKEEHPESSGWDNWRMRQTQRELGSTSLIRQMTDTDVIPEGITADGVRIGGMSVAEARQTLKDHFTALSSYTISVNWEGKETRTTTPADLGLDYDIEAVLRSAAAYSDAGSLIQTYRNAQDLKMGRLELTAERGIGEDGARFFLERLNAEYGTAPTEAVLTMTDGTFSVTEDADGVEADIEATLPALLSAAEAGQDTSVQVVTRGVRPHYQTEALSQVHDSLGRFATAVESSSEERQHNISLAVSRIDGTVLMPGDQVSVSKLMGERTQENGYEEGTAYVNGVAESAVGGGICQVSSTLYNALLNAELQIDERHQHTLTVTYITPGRDATISENSKDLVFTNNLEYPVYISGDTDGLTVIMTVYGRETRPEGRTLEFPTTVINESVVPEGATPEIEVMLEKVVYMNGVEESREQLHTDYYLAPGTEE